MNFRFSITVYVRIPGINTFEEKLSLKLSGNNNAEFMHAGGKFSVTDGEFWHDGDFSVKVYNSEEKIKAWILIDPDFKL